MTGGTEFSEAAEITKDTPEIAEAQADLNKATFEAPSKVEEGDIQAAEKVQEAFVESVPLAQAAEASPASSVTEGTVPPPETPRAAQEDLDQGRSAENQSEVDQKAAGEVQSVAAEISTAALTITLEGAPEAGKVTIDRAVVAEAAGDQGDVKIDTVPLPEKPAVADQGSVKIDTVPLPEKPAAAGEVSSSREADSRDDDSRESIGTWPTPEAPVGEVERVDPAAIIDSNDGTSREAIIDSNDSPSSIGAVDRADPAAIIDSNDGPGTVSATDRIDAAEIIDSNDRTSTMGIIDSNDSPSNVDETGVVGSIDSVKEVSPEIPETGEPTVTDDITSETSETAPVNEASPITGEFVRGTRTDPETDETNTETDETLPDDETNTETQEDLQEIPDENAEIQEQIERLQILKANLANTLRILTEDSELLEGTEVVLAYGHYPMPTSINFHTLEKQPDDSYQLASTSTVVTSQEEIEAVLQAVLSDRALIESELASIETELVTLISQIAE